MEGNESVSWFSTPLTQLGVSSAGLIIAFIARRTWHRCAREFDRSMLIWLGTGSDFLRYGNAPIIVGRFPFSDLDEKVRSNLDVRDVIGFVVGPPRWVKAEDFRRLRILPDRKSLQSGFYAYCVIHWEHADWVKRLENRGFHIRRTSYDGPNAEEGMRERIFVGFGTDATPDVEGNRPAIVHIDAGWLASFRYQPYQRGGFEAEDIEMRALAPQVKYPLQTINRVQRFASLVKKRMTKCLKRNGSSHPSNPPKSNE